MKKQTPKPQAAASAGATWAQGARVHPGWDPRGQSHRRGWCSSPTAKHTTNKAQLHSSFFFFTHGNFINT